MMRIALLRLICILAVVMVQAPQDVHSQTCDGTSRPDTIVDRPDHFAIRGTVVDDNRTPIANADISLAAPSRLIPNWFGDIDPQLAIIRSRTDENGRFALGFDRSNRDFAQYGDRTLVVSCDGYSHLATTLPLTRMYADAPLEIEMSRVDDLLKFTVLDANQRPLRGAVVLPASVAGVRLPWNVAHRFSNVSTDESGEIRMPNVSAESLDAVFISHPETGNQRVPLSISLAGSLVATSRPSRNVVGMILSPEGSPIPEIETMKLYVVSAPLEKYQHPNTTVECGWAVASIEPSGEFTISQLALGDLIQQISCPPSFPFRNADSQRTVKLLADDGPFQLAMTYEKQAKCFVAVTTSDDKPLTDIAIRTMDGRIESTATDKEGKAFFFRSFSRSMCFPFDATGHFFRPEAFYEYVNDPPVDGVVDFPPQRLARRSEWQGRVIDDQTGEPVPGAMITVEFSQERFARTVEVYSNNDGTFSLIDVANGTTVRIQASTDRQRSEPQSILLPESDGLELKLISQPIAQPVGRVVDLNGNGVANVSVSINKPNVTQEETYNREESMRMPLFNPAITVRTDNGGKFAFPPTMEFAQRLAIEVSDKRFFLMQSPLLDGTKLPISNQDSDKADAAHSPIVDLGALQIMRRPDLRKVSIRIVSISGTPIESAEVVLVGGRIGKTVGTTNAAGRFETMVPDGDGVIAVRADGFHLIFDKFGKGTRHTGNRQMSIELVPNSSPNRSGDEGNSIVDVKPQEFLQAAEKIFASLETPEPKSVTPYRLRQYLVCLSALSPKRFVEFVEQHQGENGIDHAAIMASEMNIQIGDLLHSSLAADILPNTTYFQLRAANASPDKEARSEWLAEALVSADDAQKRSQCVLAFLAAEEPDLAKQVADEMWQDSAELRKLVDENKRVHRRADARLIGPALAATNLRTAVKLIELTADPDEIERLKISALLNWGILNRESMYEQLVKQAAKISKGEFDRGVSTWMMHIEPFDRLGWTGVSDPHSVATLIEDPSVRLKFLTFHAKLARDQETRNEMVKQIAKAVVETANRNRAETGIMSHSYYAITEPDELLRRIPRQVLDGLLFEMILGLPDDFEGAQRPSILASVARIMALRDRGLARRLLEPLIADHGWMFPSYSRYVMYRNYVIDSASRIDPKWAVGIVDELCDREMKHDSADVLDLRSGAIQSLSYVRSLNLSGKENWNGETGP